MKRFTLNILLLLGWLGVAFAQGEVAGSKRPPEVHTRFTPDSILIGDQFRMELDIDKDVSQEIHLPQFDGDQLTDEIEMIAIEGVDTLEKNGRRVKLRVVYRLTSFEEGIHPVTGFPVLWTEGVVAEGSETVPDTVFSSDMMLLKVNSFEIDTTKQTIFDIKRPLNTPLIFAEIKDWVMWGALIVVLLAALIYLTIRYVRKRKGKVKPKKILPPHVLAIKSLEKLHSRKLWQNGKHKDYYSNLVDIVRIYIERRYGVGAMEMTSDQILSAMESVNEERLRIKLSELFDKADLVKFAKMEPSPEDNEQAYFDAYFYVEETKEMELLPDGTPALETKDEKEVIDEH